MAEINDQNEWKTVRFIVQVPPSLKNKVQKYAKGRGTNSSTVIRQLLIDLVQWEPGEGEQSQ